MKFATTLVTVALAAGSMIHAAPVPPNEGSNGDSSTSDGHTSITNGHLSNSNGHVTLPNGHSLISNGHSYMPNGDSHIANGEVSASKGYHNPPKVTSIKPEDHWSTLKLDVEEAKGKLPLETSYVYSDLGRLSAMKEMTHEQFNNFFWHFKNKYFANASLRDAWSIQHIRKAFKHEHDREVKTFGYNYPAAKPLPMEELDKIPGRIDDVGKAIENIGKVFRY